MATENYARTMHSSAYYNLQERTCVTKGNNYPAVKKAFVVEKWRTRKSERKKKGNLQDKTEVNNKNQKLKRKVGKIKKNSLEIIY